MKLQYKSYAKLNLFIRVLEKRPDGYHNIQSIFEKINLFDDMIFEKRKDNKIIIKSNVKSLEKKNIIFDVINLMKNKSNINNFGLNVYLRKTIPVGAGLGGGSSNAAITFMALNKLWDMKMSIGYLKKISLIVGSDVPFFLTEGNAWVEGIGDIITPIYTKPRYYILVNAGTCVSTRKIYKLIDNEVKHAPYDYDDYVGNRTNNDFLSVVLSLFPEIRTMYDHLMKIAPIKLTGTGGTFYFTCESEIDAKNLIKRIPRKYHPMVVKSLSFN